MKQKWVKRIARAMLPCFVFFVFSFSFAPKAHAVEFKGSVTYGYYRDYLGNATLAVVNGTLPITNADATPGGGTAYYYNYRPFVGTDQAQVFDGTVKIYASFAAVPMSGCDYVMGPAGNFMSPSGWTVTYINSYEQDGFVNGGLDSITTFTDSGAFNRTGYAIEATYQGSEAFPVRALRVFPSVGNDIRKISGGTNGLFDFMYRSIRVITSTRTEEVEALDGIADEIAAQTDILQAMKGDMVAILQDIYTMTGDIHAAQNLLNGYINRMLPLLEDIADTNADIYALLSTQLRLLETAIENAADSVEAAIAAQTAAMIAYLDSVLNTGNEVPDDTYQQQQDATNILDQMESLEKPNVDTIVPEIGDYSDSGVSGVLSAIFSSNLIVTMMTLSASFAFGAYVLFGKRE